MTARDSMPAARILHVDDQPETHEWLKLALERKQYEVTVATDGHSALASFATHRPDVVLLDHELPDQSGLEVLRQLKNADPLVEIVMLTGHGSVSLAVEAMREGAFNFVEKPVELTVSCMPRRPVSGWPPNAAMASDAWSELRRRCDGCST